MCTFALRLHDSLPDKKKKIRKLYINGECYFDEFEKHVLKVHRKEYERIFSYISHYADGMLLPKTKMRVIDAKKIKFQLWEFKCKELRVYTFDDTNLNYRIIVNAGYKKSQPADIERLKRTVKKYINIKYE
ncbi:MAG: hypothetical protein BWY27_00954 [Bacteroidetes bacterium ADurb.Bin234]|nr:MAG: hypothetical protein BWY27_00954 [Bacteroidetes bacterium ADurb.Bin234]